MACVITTVLPGSDLASTRARSLASSSLVKVSVSPWSEETKPSPSSTKYSRIAISASTLGDVLQRSFHRLQLLAHLPESVLHEGVNLDQRAVLGLRFGQRRFALARLRRDHVGDVAHAGDFLLERLDRIKIAHG